MASIFDFEQFSKRRPSHNPNGEPPVDNSETEKAIAILKNGIKNRLIIFLILMFAVFLWNQCVVITKPNEFIVIQQLGEIRSVRMEPGVSFKLPIIQNARTLPSTLQIYDIPVTEVITQDKRTMNADSFVLWRIQDPSRFIRQLGGSLTTAESHIGHNSYNSMKNVISRMQQTDIISGRDELSRKIFENLGNTLDQYGVTLVGIETKALDLPDANKQAVYARMISERNNIAASYHAEGEEEARKIRNETDREVSVRLAQANSQAARTIAEGEQRYMEILAEAYNAPEKAEFYAFVRALDASKKAYQGGETTLILGRDSPIARVFYSY